MAAPSSQAAPLCLASASPRRRALLEQLGVPYVCAVPDIDEAVLPGEPAEDYVARIARAKAHTAHPHAAGLPVLAADTTVLIDQQILGKPADAEQAIAMLLQLSGRSHQVLTAVALAVAGEITHRLSRSEVRFRHLSLDEAVAYWNTGEPRDKAGAYAVQGHGAVFIEHLSGSYSGVMGLPLFETAELLAGAGLPYWLDQPAGGVAR
ncbi:MAG: septum formation inhibitor Maf [Gammaproteobacteria bacterium]|nr:septum formation inhibitor Maf [Gammaproteobacteria bacterium]MBV9315934.1 septum formation inhibitor Maf [Gammaproteobacteria bacterium]MBV9726420.1 septum formation inhibitor Maf [Gammaproteobacteria bacterium]